VVQIWFPEVEEVVAYGVENTGSFCGPVEVATHVVAHDMAVDVLGCHAEDHTERLPSACSTRHEAYRDSSVVGSAAVDKSILCPVRRCIFRVQFSPGVYFCGWILLRLFWYGARAPGPLLPAAGIDVLLVEDGEALAGAVAGTLGAETSLA
jgi:hypothetical protein